MIFGKGEQIEIALILILILLIPEFFFSSGFTVDEGDKEEEEIQGRIKYVGLMFMIWVAKKKLYYFGK